MWSPLCGGGKHLKLGKAWDGGYARFLSRDLTQTRDYTAHVQCKINKGAYPATTSKVSISITLVDSEYVVICNPYFPGAVITIADFAQHSSYDWKTRDIVGMLVALL